MTSLYIKVTICVLTHGRYTDIVQRCIDSVRRYCNRSEYRLIVGGNAVTQATRLYVEGLLERGDIDGLYLSEENINKCPMMRRMFSEIDTEFIWWLDDDSHLLSKEALPMRLEIAGNAPSTTVMWGHLFYEGHEDKFNYGLDIKGFVRSTPWYRGKPVPDWEQGGRGEYNFEGRGIGDGRWFYICGACWLIRTRAIRALNWPDPALLKPSDDVFLYEAIRQHEWDVHDIGPLHVCGNDGPRRGCVENIQVMRKQINFYDPTLGSNHFF